MQAWLNRVWLQRGLAAWLLWPVSWIFAALVATRRLLYRMGVFRSGQAGVPVVVVGNVLVGGVGKTPVVMAVVRHLQARGLRVGVLSRGHGRSAIPGHPGDGLEVLDDSQAHQAGDEPALMKKALSAPIFVALRRLEAARALLAKYPAVQCLVCDDGLQHYALRRDVEVCVFDARGVGNGWLLPAGPLREGWPRVPLALGGAPSPVGLTLCSVSSDSVDWQSAPALSPVFRANRRLADDAVDSTGRRTPLEALRGRPLAAVAGIAQPEQFFSMLRKQGLMLASTEALPDHYSFDSWIRCIDQEKTLICTEKDAVKIWLTHPGALAVPLCIELDQAFLAALDQAVDAAVQSYDRAHGHPIA
jgi:tetraacyldisaccharide 4'-kinase